MLVHHGVLPVFYQIMQSNSEWLQVRNILGPVRHFNKKLFLNKNINCGYSSKVPCWGASDEYQQHTFHEEIKKKYSDTAL